MSISKKLFGQTKSGKDVYLYTLLNENGMEIRVTNLGAILVSVFVPDADGNLRDVVLGYDKPADYENGICFFGATLGRNANRIGGACFSLNGKQYQLAANAGKNSLHSNPDGYQNRIWEANVGDNELGDSVSFSLESPDGDQGFPGEVNVAVTYTLTSENAIMIHYKAVSDKDTIINMSNHSYFNLDGHDAGTAMNQKVWIDADCFTEANAESIPTGKLISVENTPMDFRTPTAVGARINEAYEALEQGGGYDHNWVLNNKGENGLIAKVISEQSGIEMDVFTDLPGVQFYTANFVNKEQGKNGAVYNKRDAICLETQYFPDAIHHSEFASSVCKAGEEYETTTTYQFSIKK